MTLVDGTRSQTLRFCVRIMLSGFLRRCQAYSGVLIPIPNLYLELTCNLPLSNAYSQSQAFPRSLRPSVATIWGVNAVLNVTAVVFGEIQSTTQLPHTTTQCLTTISDFNVTKSAWEENFGFQRNEISLGSNFLNST